MLALSPKSKLFSAVIDDYVRFRERDHAHGRTSDGMLTQIIRVANNFHSKAARDAPLEDMVLGYLVELDASTIKKLPRSRKVHCWSHNVILPRETQKL